MVAKCNVLGIFIIVQFECVLSSLKFEFWKNLTEKLVILLWWDFQQDKIDDHTCDMDYSALSRQTWYIETFHWTNWQLAWNLCAIYLAHGRTMYLYFSIRNSFFFCVVCVFVFFLGVVWVSLVLVCWSWKPGKSKFDVWKIKATIHAGSCNWWK